MKSNTYIKELEKHIGEEKDYLKIVGVKQYGRKCKIVAKCICGNTIELTLAEFHGKSRKTCGCMYSNKGKQNNRFVHGLSRTRIYRIYRGMCNRCLDKNSISYKDYGGRGITICSEWLGENGLTNFKEWADKNGFDENAKAKDCSLDRIDPLGNYSPDNCRFANSVIQNNNKRNNRKYEINGTIKTLSQWCREYNIPCVQSVYSRLEKGMDIETALQRPMQKKVKDMSDKELEERKKLRLEKARKWRAEHREQIRESRRKWVENNPEKNRESKRKYEKKRKLHHDN